MTVLTRHLDLPRALIGLVAAAIGLLAALAVAADGSMAGHELAAGVFGLEGVAAGAFALLPSPGQWTEGRRRAAGGFTTVSIVAGLVLVVSVGARAACACGDGTLPTVLGIGSTSWMDLGTFGIPLLIALAASTFPDRLTRAAPAA